MQDLNQQTGATGRYTLLCDGVRPADVSATEGAQDSSSIVNNDGQTANGQTGKRLVRLGPETRRCASSPRTVWPCLDCNQCFSIRQKVWRLESRLKATNAGSVPSPITDCFHHVAIACNCRLDYACPSKTVHHPVPRCPSPGPRTLFLISHQSC